MRGLAVWLRANPLKSLLLCVGVVMIGAGLRTWFGGVAGFVAYAASIFLAILIGSLYLRGKRY